MVVPSIKNTRCPTPGTVPTISPVNRPKVQSKDSSTRLLGNACRASLYDPVLPDRCGCLPLASTCRRLQGFGQKLLGRPSSNSSTPVSSVPPPCNRCAIINHITTEWL